MPRPGGNPNLVSYQFTTKRVEPLLKQVTIRVGETMNEYLLDQKIPHWQELTRQYWAKLLKEEGFDVPDY